MKISAELESDLGALTLSKNPSIIALNKPFGNEELLKLILHASQGLVCNNAILTNAKIEHHFRGNAKCRPEFYEETEQYNYVRHKKKINKCR